MAYQIKYAYICHMGKVRGNNEDNFWCCGNTLPSDNRGMEEIHTGVVPGRRFPALAVFDGMGGESCGEMAAFLASEEFGRYYVENRNYLKKDPENFIDGICRSMNKAVCSYGKENKIGSMGTTAAMVLFCRECVYACNLGDSRIYVANEEKFRRLSTDHVLGGSIFGKAPLTQFLGIPEEQQMPEPSVVRLEQRPGDRYLLCSDGMTDMLSDEEIADVLARDITPAEAVELFLERVLEKGGKDNVTIVLCEVQKQEQKDIIKTWLNSLRKDIEG